MSDDVTKAWAELKRALIEAKGRRLAAQFLSHAAAFMDLEADVEEARAEMDARVVQFRKNGDEP